MSRAQIIKDTVKALPPQSSKALQDFAGEFFARVPDDDLVLMTPAVMARVTADHWDMTHARAPGQPAIRAYTRAAGEGEGSMGHTVINIVNDDMAFLVDSVAAEIARHGRIIHQLVHPILHVRHDAKGKINYISATGDDTTHAQSHMHIEIVGALPDATIRELVADLADVLRDVRFATTDWLRVKDKLLTAQKGLANGMTAQNKAEFDEYLSFLEYIYKDNFTLLGCRETRVNDKGERKVVPSSNLGLLSDKIKPAVLTAGDMPDQDHVLRGKLPALAISKINKQSTVHRRVPLDAFTVRQYDDNGKVSGEFVFIGLFTSVTYSRSINDVPLLRRKAEAVMAKSAFRPGTHNHKALRHILEKYPRDELFQIETDDLLSKALSILLLQERQRIALYTRTDIFGRYISCLVYIPRDRYNSDLRRKFQLQLESDLSGECRDFYTTLDDSPLARVIYMIYLDGAKVPKFNEKAIEQKLQELGRLWKERLADSLLAHYSDDDDQIRHFLAKYGDAFPQGYTDTYLPKQSIYDIGKLEEAHDTGRLALDVYRCKDCTESQLRLKIFSRGTPVPLSDVLPVLENMGLRVSAEWPFEVRPAGNGAVWIHDFIMTTEFPVKTDDIALFKAQFEEALSKIWYGDVENDGLNRLVVSAAMNWRDVMILRACVRYLRQTSMPYSTAYIERALTNNKGIAHQIVKLFHALFDPKSGSTAAADAIRKAIETALTGVASLDEDRIIRSAVNLVNNILRTNFFQPDKDGNLKTYLSFKIDSKQIPELPEPKPFREIYVYSPWAEGVHLRADRIARGGIRWSDRHEDFRTEVLGLMKAQQVKNAIIVPMGAKGGFIVKNPPAFGDRKALMAEGIRCYQTLVRGMLDITDNRKGKKVVAPANVVRRDEEDPYLVVAADKGTASFSDIANALSAEYGFWLGDAFASGGSAGYDHKKMGITARGAWESVKRHFREMGVDIQTQPFDVIGVGDMGGDVFGNGMLLSPFIKLVGAFNHVHIFCDPNPDPASSFRERKRLFEGVLGWDEYNQKLLSKGGRIYSRKDKSLQLTPEIKARFGIDKDAVSPPELIVALLKAQTDLLWFGGIGTYIKAAKETHAEVGDKTNESLRINATEIKAKVVGEGANLAMTQRARIEYAQAGGRLNTDFVDNSGGVDSSDHEVNIKILTTEIMSAPGNTMTTASRNKLLESMTAEVGDLVLRNNYQQTQGLSMMELQAVEHLPLHARFIAHLENKHAVDRALEGLPDEETIKQRQNSGRGLTRPELAIVQAYAKILFTRDLLETDIPDREEMEDYWLLHYFPEPLRKKFSKEIRHHRLRREIVATTMSTSLINRMGPTFVKGLMDKTGATTAGVACAYLVVREAFDLRTLWDRIEALDGTVPGMVQLKAMRDIVHMVEHETMWFLTRLGREPDTASDIEIFHKGVSALRDGLMKAATPDQTALIAHRTETAIRDGMPKDLARDIAILPILGTACDITRISNDLGMPIVETARTYYELGEYFHIDWLRAQARITKADDRWSSEALEALTEQLYSCQAGLTARVMNDMRKDIKAGKCGNGKGSIVKAWVASHEHLASGMAPLLNAFRREGVTDLSMLIIAEQRLRALHGG